MLSAPTNPTFIRRDSRSARARYGFQLALSWLLTPIRSRRFSREIFAAVEKSFQRGTDFEEFDPLIGTGKTPRAKVIAFYLPQYHSFAENNRNWGEGFTEWTNLSRNIPRYRGHIAPRVPRDLGFYDLSVGDIQRRQADMARKAGLHGFCYYYYRFDEHPFMDAPLERMLSDREIDFPFCVMWCNESWTRGWVGKPRSMIAEQKYDPASTLALVDDLARLMRDARYIRVAGRPLLTIYRPSLLPDPPGHVARLRDLFRTRHGLDVLLAMAQTDLAVDPRPYALDGAVEFIANKFRRSLRRVLSPAEFFDTDFKSKVYDFDELVDLSLSEPASDFPVVRSVMPHWDKNPRRPGRGFVVHGSTPRSFEDWTSRLLDQSAATPFFGENMLFVNAWNEWAESAYLEPDTHFGAAYLNSLARAVFRPWPPQVRADAPRHVSRG